LPLARLREVVTAGERLQVTPQIAALFSRLDGAPLRNQYGPSESHVVTELVLSGDALSWPSLPTIGRPISDTAVYVVDRDHRLVPVGVAGELVIGGAGLAFGYLSRPSLTAEKFIPDAFSRTPGARLYRSGDLVRWRTDGELDFLGRIDHQVKIRGFRIEPGEVEAALAGIPGVREAAVVAREDAPGTRRLVAYVVAAPGAELAEAALRHPLAQSLPGYMVPAVCAFLASLPLTPNGKPDRKALPTPEEAPGREKLYVAPRDPVEETLAGIWEEVLERERVGVEDD